MPLTSDEFQSAWTQIAAGWSRTTGIPFGTFFHDFSIRLDSLPNRSVALAKVRDSADRRAMALLRKALTPVQQRQLRKEDAFAVIGGRGGRYVVTAICTSLRLQAVDLDDSVLRVRPKSLTAYCFQPVGDLPDGDILLARKSYLEAQEGYFLYEAVPTGGDWTGFEAFGIRTWAERLIEEKMEEDRILALSREGGK